MRRLILCPLAILLLLLACPAAQGQEPAPLRITAAALADGGPLSLTLAWRHHPGDDPRWAAPDFDDSAWQPAEPQQRVGWFRRHLRIEPALFGKPLVIRLQTPGATRVFLDGSPLMEAAAPAGRRTGVWREVVFTLRPDHVLAVRHTGPPGFLLSIEPTSAAALQLAAERRQALKDAALSVVPAVLAAFLALFHLALYFFYPKARENLFYALTVAQTAAMLLVGLVPMDPDLSVRLFVSGILLTTFFGVLTYYEVRVPVFPRTWTAIAATGAGLILLVFLHPEPPYSWIWTGYFGLVVLEILRMEITRRETIHREGRKILLAGFLILTLSLVLQVLIQFGRIHSVAGVTNVWVFGMFAFEISMSLFLARSFATTSLQLERRLDEVRTLSEEVLRQRLLEAEHARKIQEIEAARSLQLSMLPAALPSLPGLETAATMIPASEVGGDYYDFRIEPDGSLVVAFGDAAGHGVAAGILVTAVKAIFSTLGGGESLAAALAEHDRVLRAMQARPLYMCLALARLTPNEIAVCSAGMPPVLIHRAATGEVEELGEGGRPIGSRLTGAWTEHRAPLAPGDTLLFASDGLAEQLDAEGNLFSYERQAEELRASAGGAPREVVDRLVERMVAWRGGQEQGDDVTLVAIRVDD
ncbi:MAG TPA: SpoIIE family protein phosphatase [Thermoanaerobaculia bacterium]|jgi:serine phosphatase RsbU (regulator of sigma subunit)|nr:SpoIIE family protein phosphatase [Thermoanaerobaculia bacterium]